MEALLKGYAKDVGAQRLSKENPMGSARIANIQLLKDGTLQSFINIHGLHLAKQNLLEWCLQLESGCIQSLADIPPTRKSEPTSHGNSKWCFHLLQDLKTFKESHYPHTPLKTPPQDTAKKPYIPHH